MPNRIPTSFLRLSAALSACAVLGGCASVHRSVPVGAPPTAVLVDSIPQEDESGYAVVLHRIELRQGSTVDTLPGVLVAEPPVVTRAAVHGFAYEGTSIAHGFRYDLRTRRITEISLPRHLISQLSTPALSPDGRHLAYVALPHDGNAYGVVMTWPKRRHVVRSPGVPVPATDFAFEYALWTSAEDFELYIDLGASDGLWHRFRGSLRDRTLAADSVREIGGGASGAAPSSGTGTTSP